MKKWFPMAATGLVVMCLATFVYRFMRGRVPADDGSQPGQSPRAA